MIYVDSSVALAKLLAEPQAPPESFWDQPLASSRLLQYEIWNRINARRLTQTHGHAVGALLDHIILIELLPGILGPALDLFPVAVRTLDGLHLASIDYLRSRSENVELASYDARLIAAARALRVSILPL